jgi:hypothetical protein
MSHDLKLIRNFLLAAIIAASVITAQSQTPGERVNEFLNKYHLMKFSGLPDEKEAKELSLHFSPNFNKLIHKAFEAQQKFKTKFPDEKPPLIEGDLFSSLFEGFTSFEIIETKINHDKAEVTVKFRYTDPKQKSDAELWNDRYRLIKYKSIWLIDDVEYMGKWDFAPKGTLRGLLREAVKDGE